MNRFVIVGNSRTGTSMLRSSISNHSYCLCLPEILTYCDKDRKNCSQAELEEDNYFNRNEGRTIKEYLDDVLVSHKKMKGFKILSNDVELWDIWNYFNEENYKVIMIVRNYIMSFVSLLQAEQTGQFNIYGNERIIESKPVTIKLEEFYNDLKKRSKYDLKALQKIRNVYIVRYKDLLFDYRNAMNGVFDFLGVPHMKVTPKTIKLNRSKLKDRVTNLDMFLKDLDRSCDYLKDDLI